LIHERLKQAREARGATLESVAGEIGVRARLLEIIESGAFAELPAGVYGRSSVRAYASAMGLNPEEALAEVAHLLVRPEDPLDGLARVKGHRRKPSARDAEPARHGCPPPATEPGEPPPPFTTSGDDDASPRLTWASTRADWWRPVVASLVDGALLGAIELVLIWLTVLACGTGIGPTLRVAGPAMAMLFVLIATLYFVLLGGVRNETLGTRVAGLRRARTRGTALDVRAVLVRARHCFTRQMPAPAEWRPAGG
jgi:transcriptional regulator with XRE-family HTH domain